MRSYDDWERDAIVAKDEIIELGNELRKCWPQWKRECRYATLDECLQDMLGISATALRKRNARVRNAPERLPERDATPTQTKSNRTPTAVEAEVITETCETTREEQLSTLETSLRQLSYLVEAIEELEFPNDEDFIELRALMKRVAKKIKEKL